ncbi:hypothetical protein K469DRAFT_336791 [Zopfia rhizophila CBS 207.26]|uniref:Uncharacterized protein n=1 Tax=Zopfia rhizophila CBS 207.26 TaxID=1314779 RepID=A0A6A6DFT6_9PEZI|nr:hypothetical protein K469DRAFT_336791 [Zopfia rhizophila CBS 207.26]
MLGSYDSPAESQSSTGERRQWFCLLYFNSNIARPYLLSEILFLSCQTRIATALTSVIRRTARYDQNTREIGLSLELIMRPNCISPFYLSTCSSLSISLPPDLHSTPFQLRFPHHPFMDLILFPWFPGRAIAFAAKCRPVYDLFQLKRDILSGRLVCCKS